MSSKKQIFPKPNNSCSQDPGLCALCAKRGTTCCYIAPEKAELCFPLSKPETERLQAHCRGSLSLGKASNSPEFLSVMYSLFPGESVVVTKLFPADAQHLTLGTDQEGFCLHLGPAGCTLPREIRPWFCRLFPLWVSRGELTAFSADYCLIAQQSISVRGMLKKINQNEAEVIDIYNRLRVGWGFVPHISGVKPG